ncbi:hypothetical protein ACLOJK_001798 [Asimina triloba]
MWSGGKLMVQRLQQMLANVGQIQLLQQRQCEMDRNSDGCKFLAQAMSQLLKKLPLSDGQTPELKRHGQLTGMIDGKWMGWRVEFGKWNVLKWKVGLQRALESLVEHAMNSP